MNREEWLTEVVKRLEPVFKDHGYELPPVRVSVGWPSRGGTSSKKRVVGECWKASVAQDGVSQIFVSPMMANAKDVVHVLVHELIHAWDKGESGHRGKFTEAAKDMGLVKPWTATSAGPDLAEWTEAMLAEMVAYPHSLLTPTVKEKPQSTRMIKAECPDTGYIARTTRKWLDAYGAPICPCCDTSMIVEVKEDE